MPVDGAGNVTPAFYTGAAANRSATDVSMESYDADGQQVVNFFFPVEVVIVGSLPEEERELIKERIYRELHAAVQQVA
jgi:hypothetical protein